MNRKLIVVAAPSGAGKTTIVRHLLQTFDTLAFSVSAATRTQRAHEINGKDYYFITETDFRQKIEQDEFLEWQEVYTGQFYGTLKSEVIRLWELGKVVIFDIDVQGALNIKRTYPEETHLVFVKPPSPAILFQRLRAPPSSGRGGQVGIGSIIRYAVQVASRRYCRWRPTIWKRHAL